MHWKCLGHLLGQIAKLLAQITKKIFRYHAMFQTLHVGEWKGCLSATKLSIHFEKRIHFEVRECEDRVLWKCVSLPPSPDVSLWNGISWRNEELKSPGVEGNEGGRHVTRSAWAVLPPRSNLRNIISVRNYIVFDLNDVPSSILQSRLRVQSRKNKESRSAFCWSSVSSWISPFSVSHSKVLCICHTWHHHRCI